mgnify:CR=1 FL=1
MNEKLVVSYNSTVESADLSRLRIYLLRGLYLITFIGLAKQAWTEILIPDEPLDYITGVAFSNWAS